MLFTNSSLKYLPLCFFPVIFKKASSGSNGDIFVHTQTGNKDPCLSFFILNMSERSAMRVVETFMQDIGQEERSIASRFVSGIANTVTRLVY